MKRARSQAEPAQQGSGGAAPALVHTPAYLNRHIPNSLESLASPFGEWTRFGDREAAIAAEKQDRLADAYLQLGRELRAGDIRWCGHAVVKRSPEGALLRNAKTGVPVAQILKCRAKFCQQGCEAEKSRKRRVNVQEKLLEIHLRSRSIGPLWQPPAREAADLRARVRELVANTRATQEALEAHASIGAELPGPAPELRHRAARLIIPRRQRRPLKRSPRPLVNDDGSRGDLVPTRGAYSAEEDEAQFTVGPATGPRSYGARLLTLTQPDRTDECLSEGLDRIEEAIARFQRSPVWQAHVDGAVIRIEFERSTPKRRRLRVAQLRALGNEAGARELETRGDGEWWHVHAHVLMWGRHWPQKPHPRVPWCCPASCKCTRCAGVDDEDSLLLCWRRALVGTGRYDAELERAGIPPRLLEGALRRHAHATRRTWARPLLGEWEHNGERVPAVKIGGARVELPRRRRRRRRGQPDDDTGWRALCEVIKYNTKPAALAALPPERIAEAVEATDHRRLIRCTGFLFGVHMLEEDDDERPVEEYEGVEHVEHVGRVAVDDAGRVWTEEEWIDDPSDLAQRERRAQLRRVDAAHRKRRAEATAGGP